MDPIIIAAVIAAIAAGITSAQQSWLTNKKLKTNHNMEPWQYLEMILPMATDLGEIKEKVAVVEAHAETAVVTADAVKKALEAHAVEDMKIQAKLLDAVERNW